ncbi:MAG: PDZ domain-containing protein, partial [Calditrichia bacterium]
AGIISALGRDIRIINERYSVENFIQTDAVINPGNSGGALVNLNGELIGINTAIATRTGLYQGYGFAIPSNLAIKVVSDILQYGEVHRALLGVSISAVDNVVAKGVGLPRPTGVFVQGVEADYPAEKAGIESGDVILSVNGEEVSSVSELQSKIAQKHPGDPVNVQIWRNNRRINKQVMLGKAPVGTNNNSFSREQPKKSFDNLGLEVRDLTGSEENSFETENGAFIEEVKMGSPAFLARLRPGTVILSLDNQPVEDAGDFKDKVSRMKSGEVIRVMVRNIGNGVVNDQILFVQAD